MTIDEFLEFIHNHSRPGDWVPFYNNAIRHKDNSTGDIGPGQPCPICWVATQMGQNPEGWYASFDHVAGDIGVSPEDSIAIAAAADGQTGPLHQRLLAACHLDATPTEYDLGGEG